MKKYKYVIVTPNTNNGGPIVLHALCKCLNELGKDAKVFYPGRYFLYKDQPGKFWIYFLLYTLKSIFKRTFHFISGNKNTDNHAGSQIKCKRKYLPFVGKNTIVVYPEVMFGNFLHSKKVVRWLLYHNKLYSQDNDKTIGYNKKDLFFCYRDIFNDEKLNPERRKLTLTYFDLDLYKRTNFGNRKGNCYIIRKGYSRNDLPKGFDGPIVDDLSEKEKVKIFNECEYCISYDTQTAYSKIAALCGCISIVVPEEGKTRNDYRGPNDCDYGEAFGFSDEEIKYSLETATKVQERYKMNNEYGFLCTRNFINECENYFSD